MKKQQSIMMVTGEASGDMHGARLVKSLCKIHANLSIRGMGGPAMKREGVDILYDATKVAVVGILEVFTHLKDIISAFNRLKKSLRESPPDLLILIDLPDFNLRLARFAKKLNIPVLYYISPQIWAWRSGRVHKIAKLVDRMAVILPFEKDFYENAGVNVDFVGHPLLDTIQEDCSPTCPASQESDGSHQTIIGILPGSRKKEITNLLPVFIQVAEKISLKHPEIHFVISKAPGISKTQLQEHVSKSISSKLTILDSGRYNTFKQCVAVLAASGTVTLELALLGIPMVVAYKVSSFTYWLATKLVEVPYVTLVNLIAQKEVVPEFVQDQVTIENLHNSLNQLLEDTDKRNSMKNDLDKVKKLLGGPGASDRTAEIAYSMIKSH